MFLHEIFGSENLFETFRIFVIDYIFQFHDRHQKKNYPDFLHQSYEQRPPNSHMHMKLGPKIVCMNENENENENANKNKRLNKTKIKHNF